MTSDVLDHMVGAAMLDQGQTAQVRAHMQANSVGAAKAAVELGFITTDQAVDAAAGAAGVRVIRDLADTRCEAEALAMIPKAKARRWNVVPLRFEGETLVLAATLAAASNGQLTEDLRLALNGRPFLLVVAPERDLRAKLDAEYRNEMEIAALVGQVADGASDASDAVVRMVELTLEQAITDRASDIHLEPGASDVAVRYRIDGVLVEKSPMPKAIQAGVISRLKIMSDIDIAEQRLPQDGRLSLSRGGRKIDMRVSTLPTVHGEKVVLRILDNSSTRQTLGQFQFSGINEARWRRSFTKPSGLLLVTGPTGSGKSTTLYTTLNELARPEVNIVTVEDPVEYRIPRINQVQVNPRSGLTFAAALRSILRQDPDIILIGEIRDAETAKIAIEAAQTGHLVLSTLHTNNAPEAATRLAEMGVERFLLGAALECVLAQRLVRKLCDVCRRPTVPDPADLAAAGFAVPDGVVPTFFEPAGCARCSMTGYRGRLAVHETMIRTPELERAIVRDEPIDTVNDQALRDGMVPMRQDGWAKVAAGKTTIAEILRVVA